MMGIISRPTLIGIFAIFLFSIGSLLVALSGDFPPFQLIAMIMIVGAASIAIFQKANGNNIIEGIKAPIRLYMLMLCGIGVYQVLLITALKTAPAFEINILNYLWPILLVVFIKIFKSEPWRWNEGLGFLCGFLGLVMVLLPDNKSAAFQSVNTAHILTILAAILWAFYSAKVNGKEYSINIFIPVMTMIGIACAGLHFAFEETVIYQPFHVWIVVLIFCMTRFSYVLWDHGMRNGDQMLLSSLSYFLPLLSSLYFIAFGFMPARTETAIGAVFIIGGCLIVNWHRMKFSKGARHDKL